MQMVKEDLLRKWDKFTKTCFRSTYYSIPLITKLILENRIIESDDAARRSSEPETVR